MKLKFARRVSRTWSGDLFGLTAQQSRKLNQLRDLYDDLPTDPHLNTGEGDRYRRYARLRVDPLKRTLSVYSHDRFFQPKKFDPLYGDIHRAFAPLDLSISECSFLQMLSLETFQSLPIAEDLREEPFEISVHMIRIQATPNSGIGRPAPEGIHRDGYHFGSIHLMNRQNVRGAENLIYSLNRTLTHRLSLQNPLDSIYFDDAAILHAVTPFEPEDHELKATRDMLILLYQPVRESPQRHADHRVLRRY